MSESSERTMLARALAGEPAMRDSPERVLHRARRRTAARGLSAAVVAVAVVGAITMITALTARPGGTVGPAASTPPSSAAASVESTAAESANGSCRPPGAGRVPSPVDAECQATAAHAALLTAVLDAANVVPAGMRAVAVPGSSGEPLHFQPINNRYVAVADLVDERGAGVLFISVSEGTPPGPGVQLGCAYSAQKAGGNPPERLACVDHQLPDGTHLAVETWQFGAIRSATVTGLRGDRTWIYAYAATSSGQAQDATGDLDPAETPTRDEPPLNGDTLVRIATLPDLSFEP